MAVRKRKPAAHVVIGGRPVNPLGQVKLRGETWKARAEGEDLSKDEKIEVVRSEGLTLIVRRADQQDPKARENKTAGT